MKEAGGFRFWWGDRVPNKGSFNRAAKNGTRPYGVSYKDIWFVGVSLGWDDRSFAEKMADEARPMEGRNP